MFPHHPVFIFIIVCVMLNFDGQCYPCSINWVRGVLRGQEWSLIYLCMLSIRLETWLSGISLVIQWLRLCTPNAGGPGLIPGQGTRSHMLQLRVHMLRLKILHAATKNWYSQINIY